MNRGLSSDKITTGMLLQGLVESTEAKGFMIDIGLKDQAKAFVKFSKNDTEEDKQGRIGALVLVSVLGKTSKLIKCAFYETENAKSASEEDEEVSKQKSVVKTDLAQVTPHTLKPGFLVNGKVQKLYENGIEVSFLGGMTGTVFADHLGRSSATKFRVGEKV